MPPSDPLVELLDEGRAGDAGAARGRERIIRRMAEEGASMRGAFVDLAERGSVVTVRTECGRSHHGALLGVGADFVALRRPQGSEVLVRATSVVSVRPHPGERHQAATGDRTAPDDRVLLEALSRLAPDRVRVVLVVRGGDLVSGELRSVGADVVTVRLDGDPRSLCYVAGDAITEVAVDGA